MPRLEIRGPKLPGPSYQKLFGSPCWNFETGPMSLVCAIWQSGKSNLNPHVLTVAKAMDTLWNLKGRGTIISGHTFTFTFCAKRVYLFKMKPPIGKLGLFKTTGLVPNMALLDLHVNKISIKKTDATVYSKYIYIYVRLLVYEEHESNKYCKILTILHWRST